MSILWKSGYERGGDFGGKLRADGITNDGPS
jgi:hypothetical protein